jgi:hypothetical protein
MLLACPPSAGGNDDLAGGHPFANDFGHPLVVLFHVGRIPMVAGEVRQVDWTSVQTDALGDGVDAP